MEIHRRVKNAWEDLRPKVFLARTHTHTRSSILTTFTRFTRFISLVCVSRPFTDDIDVSLAPIGMVIRVLGQGEPLRTRGCVSVRDEGRTSGFGGFEFGDREGVCGEEKKKERSLELVFIFRNAFFSASSATLVEGSTKVRFGRG